MSVTQQQSDSDVFKWLSDNIPCTTFLYSRSYKHLSVILLHVCTWYEPLSVGITALNRNDLISLWVILWHLRPLQWFA